MKKKVEKVVFSPLENIDNAIFLSEVQSLMVDLPDEINIWNKKASEVQARFNFTIPNYILDEIIEQENSSYKDNLYCLINCAVMNHSITSENAKKIRELY